MAVDNVVYRTVPNNEKTEALQAHTVTPKGFGIRHLQALLLFLSLAIALAIRSALSVLMVAMISSHNCNITKRDNSTNITNADCLNEENSGSIYRTYDWSKSKQEIITFAFFVGYTSMQLPMGLIAQKFGGKLPLMFALGINGILSICMPWVPFIGGWIGVTVCRVVQGMAQAAFYPSTHTLLAKWSPISERGRLSTYVYSGSQIGTIFAFQLSGLFAGTPALGWPAAFWMFGMVCLLVCALLGWLGAASPHEHPRISSEEIIFIAEGACTDVIPKRRKTPWREILKCRAIWGLICAQAGSSLSYILVLTETPLYMNNVHGVDIKRNGLYSSLPYIAMCLMVWTFGYLADLAMNKKIMKVVNIRRTANTIGMAVSATFLLAFIFVKNNTLLAVCLMIMCLAAHSGVHVGFMINQIDLAPNFAGSIMALGNMIGVITSLLVPVIVTNIVTDVSNQHQWQIVFIIVASIKIFGNIIFVIFAKGEVQPWNFYGEEEYENKKELELMKDTKCDTKNGFLQKDEKKL